MRASVLRVSCKSQWVLKSRTVGTIVLNMLKIYDYLWKEPWISAFVELVHYRSSKSWQYDRGLREINMKIYSPKKDNTSQGLRPNIFFFLINKSSYLRTVMQLTCVIFRTLYNYTIYINFKKYLDCFFYFIVTVLFSYIWIIDYLNWF